MITLLTGSPGNGKSAYALSYIRSWAKKDNRQVYYSGMTLTEAGQTHLGWIEIDPVKWNECPPGAIVVTDECQTIYRNRSINASAPKYVTDLETHRHLGIDLVYITQHPMLVDPALRRLTGRHLHCVRKWGMEKSTIHEWGQVRENCDKPAGRKDSIKHHWAFDTSVYGLYKSAELHTMKRNIPWSVKLLFILPFVLAGLIYVIYNSFMKRIDVSKAAAASSSSMSGAKQIASTGARKSDDFDPVADAKKYVFMQTPRVEGLLYTSPKYDEITKPTAVPMPAACIDAANRCQCYTQQGTKMEVAQNLCIDIAHNGYFQEFNPNGPQERQESNSRQAVSRDQYAMRETAADTSSSQVFTTTPEGYGVLGSRKDGVRTPGINVDAQAKPEPPQQGYRPRVPANSPWRAS